MIKIVKEVYISDLDETSPVPVKLPMVPASATYKETDERTGSGVLKTIDFSCRLRHQVRELTGNLSVTVLFCNCRCRKFGTPDLPVRMKIEEDNLTTVSCSYQTAE